MATPPRSRTQPNSASPGPEGLQSRINLGSSMRAETGTFFLVLGTTLFLVALGLTMVLSSSSITSYVGDQGFFGVFLRQTMFAAIGIPLMLILSRFPISFWKRWAWHFFGLGILLQLLVFVPGIGIEVYGNRNWISVAGIRGQPSEFLKLAMVVWMGTVLWRKRGLLGDWKHALIPVLPGAGLAIVTVIAGHDLGTGIIMFAIVMAALYFADIKLRILAIPLSLSLLTIGVLAATSENRVGRILNFWNEKCVDFSGLCWQPQHALGAMATGGLFGVGLGNSKTKWSWLPAADNDYIFSIIGEELGMVGAIVVVLLYVVLAIGLLRIMRTARDSFGVIVTGSVLVWIVGQAFVNIAVVIGLLPVLGVPLPLLSSGGTALISCMLAIGVVLSIARDAADAAAEESGVPGERSTLPRFTIPFRKLRGKKQ
ncbi:putative lipid II flippase FtsW [Lysinibacter cavernae]|uniref:Probable peptidoglycan glycosyltransferase FtsW n=1 Tax=Lysinibacter cavernae TaxID=1640652 RepID=A0A7X5R0C0_9MICO|nr:putative lipid II flippase FtsW [Lysinibacter cavernae]NIH53090.1 cell division protein FtsW [Lysinibacter cavernae]